MPKNGDVIKVLTNMERFLPHISIDCVILGFHANELKVLLLTFKNTDFAGLPGGFIKKLEEIDEAALRILAERTGLTDIYLEQFYIFGGLDRITHIETHRKIWAANNIVAENESWLDNRFISIGYYALVDFSKTIPIANRLIESCHWFNIDEVPSLIFDHNNIIKKALETLRLKIDRQLVEITTQKNVPWATNLLPETFTMNELQSLYETILGRKLLRGNFQRKILSLGILERIEKKFTGAANKAPYLYRFNNEQI